MKKVASVVVVCFLFLGSCSLLFGPDPKPLPPSDSTLQARLLTGISIPASTVGSNGDLYLDTVAAILYVKNAGVWIYVAELLQGPQGDPGNTWITGDS
ncbi:MAG: hypothetical protein ABIJ86_16255, partial [Spirochaetota bacterium]